MYLPPTDDDDEISFLVCPPKVTPEIRIRGVQRTRVRPRGVPGAERGSFKTF